MKAFDVDVLICGAGAAGLTLALELAQRGIAFRLIDKISSPFAGSRGKGIQPRTQEIFDQLGILERIVAAGGPYPPLRRYLADGSFQDSLITEPRCPTPAEPYLQPLMVPQFLTEAVMREHLLALGHAPEFGSELQAFTQDDQGVTAVVATASGEEIIRARWLAGADGGRSFVRHALAIDFPGKNLDVRALVADVMLTGLTRDVWHRFNGSDMARQISVCPLAGTDMFQIQGPLAAEGDIDLSASGLTQIVAERTGRDNIAIHAVCWASAYNMSARLADRYRIGRVFLVGDAAHIHPPTGGQGLNTSIQDAWNLGWKLAAVVNGAPESLLESYQQERRPVAAEMLGLATTLLTAQQQDVMKRDREVHQLDIGYRGSSLALTAPAREHGLQAGDRAPDAHLRNAAGEATRLFALLRGSHWTLFGYHTERQQIAPRPGLNIHIIGQQGELADHEGHFADAYAARDGDWILVRPDGYIGAIVASADAGLLEDYFSRVGVAGASVT